jgi:hypothetical protein
MAIKLDLDVISKRVNVIEDITKTNKLLHEAGFAYFKSLSKELWDIHKNAGIKRGGFIETSGL